MNPPPQPENTIPDTDTNTPVSQIIARLAKHPDLIPLVGKILDVADDALENAPDAHQVEEQTVQLMRKLGNEVLGAWSQSTHDRAREEACRLNAGLINHRKKTSHGTADSESSA